MNNWETFESAAIAVTEQSKGNIGVNTANYQLAYDKVTEAGGDYSVQGYIDALLKSRSGEFAEAKNANELRAAYYAKAVEDWNRLASDPRNRTELGQMWKNERAEEVVDANRQQKMREIQSHLDRDRQMGKGYLPESYGKYSVLDQTTLKRMMKEDFSVWRYLCSAYNVGDVEARMNGFSIDANGRLVG